MCDLLNPTPTPDIQTRQLLGPTWARILEIMASQRIPFFRFTMNQSLAHKGYFDEHPLRNRQLADYRRLAESSLAEQRRIEAEDTLSFDDFLDGYLAMH